MVHTVISVMVVLEGITCSRCIGVQASLGVISNAGLGVVIQ